MGGDRRSHPEDPRRISDGPPVQMGGQALHAPSVNIWPGTAEPNRRCGGDGGSRHVAEPAGGHRNVMVFRTVEETCGSGERQEGARGRRTACAGPRFASRTHAFVYNGGHRRGGRAHRQQAALVPQHRARPRSRTRVPCPGPSGRDRATALLHDEAAARGFARRRAAAAGRSASTAEQANGQGPDVRGRPGQRTTGKTSASREVRAVEHSCCAAARAS